MKLKLFFILSALVAIVYAVVNPFLSGSPSTIQLWSVLVAVSAFFPAILAFIAQKNSLKTFATDYLSFRNTDWSSVAIVLGTTAVLLPVLKLIIVGLLGNLLHVSAFGELTTSFDTDIFGFIFWHNEGMSDFFLACLAEIVYLLIGGSVIGICSCIFEEIAWRGFLVKYLKGSDLTVALVSGIVWSLWSLAMTYHAATWSGFAMSLILNIVLSYYLIRIVRVTGSVWTCAMVRGMFSIGTMSFCVMHGSPVGSYIVSVVIALALIAIVKACVKQYGN